MGGLSVWLSLPRRGLTIVSHFAVRQHRHAILMARHAVLSLVFFSETERTEWGLGLSVWLSLPRRGLTIVSLFEARQRRHAILMARHAVLDVSSDRKVAGCTARCSASSLTFPACGLGIRFFLEGR